MASLHFSNPEFLFLLLLIPLLVLAHFLFLRFTRKKGMVFSNFETLKRITGKRVLTRNLPLLINRLLVVALLVVALAGPSIWYQGESQQSDYVLAIDTSGSMTADDITPNRLEGAKRVAASFIDSLQTPADVGVIGFSGTVSVEQPLTDDATAAKQAIERLKIRTISGTDIAGALITATNLMINSEEGRVIILITDGSSTTGAFIEDPVMNGVQYALDHQVTVHTIGIGRTDSVPAGYLPRLYNVTAVYNEETLSYIAEQTGGQMLSAQSDAELQAAYGQLAAESESRLQTTDLSLWVLLCGLLALFLEWGLASTRYRLIP